MKIDELPPIAIVGVLKYLAHGYLRDIQRTNKFFYGAVADTQLLGDVRYFTEGYRETARLFSLFNFHQKSRNKLIIGVLYLAFSQNYKHNLHSNHS